MLSFLGNSLSESDFLTYASLLAKAMSDSSAIIFLHGPLGVGKTTFARGFLRGYGYLGKVKSPTYTLVETYQISGKVIFHFDFYRISDPRELNHLGLQEYFSNPSISLIEWPENGLAHLPEPDLDCTISFADIGRDIILKAESDLGERLLNSINPGLGLINSQ